MANQFCKDNKIPFKNGAKRISPKKIYEILKSDPVLRSLYYGTFKHTKIVVEADEVDEVNKVEEVSRIEKLSMKAKTIPNYEKQIGEMNQKIGILEYRIDALCTNVQKLVD
jgi:hypothetical protein